MGTILSDHWTRIWRFVIWKSLSNAVHIFHDHAGARGTHITFWKKILFEMIPSELILKTSRHHHPSSWLTWQNKQIFCLSKNWTLESWRHIRLSHGIFKKFAQFRNCRCHCDVANTWRAIGISLLVVRFTNLVMMISPLFWLLMMLSSFGKFTKLVFTSPHNLVRSLTTLLCTHHLLSSK